MDTNKKSHTETIWILLAVFTFVIPIIPLVLISGYNYLTTSPESSSNSPRPSSNSSYTPAYADEPDYYEEKPDSYTESRGSSSCTSDCSGHEAGYEWGEENEICDTNYNNSYSDSFNEGVQAWAEDNCSYDEEEDYDGSYYYE